MCDPRNLINCSLLNNLLEEKLKKANLRCCECCFESFQLDVIKQCTGSTVLNVIFKKRNCVTNGLLPDALQFSELVQKRNHQYFRGVLERNAFVISVYLEKMFRES